jgi:hypothetical protein
MNAAQPESVVAASRDALRASASASVAASDPSPAAAAGPPASSSSLSAHQPPVRVIDELATVKQRITDVEGDIARVEKQLADAIEKRDRFEDDQQRCDRYDGDVKRLAKKEEQLREEKAQLRDELKRKELALEHAGE